MGIRVDRLLAGLGIDDRLRDGVYVGFGIRERQSVLDDAVLPRRRLAGDRHLLCRIIRDRHTSQLADDGRPAFPRDRVRVAGVRHLVVERRRLVAVAALLRNGTRSDENGVRRDVGGDVHLLVARRIHVLAVRELEGETGEVVRRLRRTERELRQRLVAMRILVGRAEIDRLHAFLGYRVAGRYVGEDAGVEREQFHRCWVVAGGREHEVRRDYVVLPQGLRIDDIGGLGRPQRHDARRKVELRAGLVGQGEAEIILFVALQPERG